MKIVFMGTPEFAAGALEALIRAGHVISAVVTQPDKPRGRSKELKYPPVKECALRHGIQVFQPGKIKKPDSVAKLKEYEADIFVVAAFGQILSPEILAMPAYGSLNIHASLLPKYRGTSPIQYAILNGEEKTGITIIQMDAGIDTGDMLYKREVSIERRDTFETLHDKLMEEGGKAIVEALALLEQGKLAPEKQREEHSCYAPKIEKNMGEIDFHADALTIERKIRAMTPWPSAYTYYRGKQLKVWDAVAVSETEELVSETEEPIPSTRRTPGEILEIARDFVSIAAGKGTVRIYSLQLEGKKQMSVRDFLLGVDMQMGEVLPMRSV